VGMRGVGVVGARGSCWGRRIGCDYFLRSSQVQTGFPRQFEAGCLIFTITLAWPSYEFHYAVSCCECHVTDILESSSPNRYITSSYGAEELEKEPIKDLKRSM